MGEIALGAGPNVLEHNVQIMMESDCSLLVRWSAKVYGRDLELLEAGGQTWSIPLVFVGEYTLLLQWKTKEDCEELADNLDHWQLVEEGKEVWRVIDFDSLELSDKEMDALLCSVDTWEIGDELLEWGATKASMINYNVFPKRLRSFLAACADDVERRTMKDKKR